MTDSAQSAARDGVVEPESLRSVLGELLRLYDWRNEIGRLERDFNHDRKAVKTMLNKYGREKKAAWDAARRVLSVPSEQQQSPAYHDGVESEPLEEISNYSACQPAPVAWLVIAEGGNSGGGRRAHVDRLEAEEDAGEWQINGAKVKIEPLYERPDSTKEKK